MKWRMLKRVLGPLLKKLTTYFLGQFDRTLAAIGISTDSRNTTAAEIHNKHVLAAAAAPPDPCGAANLALDTQAAGESATVSSARTDLRITAQLSTRSATQASNDLYSRVNWHAQHFGPGGKDPFGDRSLGWLSQTQLSKQGEQAGLGYADSFIGQSRDADIALPKDAQQTEEGAGYEDARSNYAARRSACMRPVLGAVSKRTPKPGHASLHENLAAEVARTYSGKHWRKRIDQYTDQTPLEKVMCNLMAFQNKLLLEQLEAKEEGNVILAAIGLEALEDPDKQARLNTAYEVAVASPDETPLKNQR